MNPSAPSLLKLVCWGIYLAVAAIPSPCLAEDGLFAVFQTDRGSFKAKLAYEKAPVTVANFVSLVEGTRGWVDTTTGLLRREPFYSGVTFHRVIPGFMIQTGSRNGRGTDGPGYSFGDEFHLDLLHSSAGTLSMANSGADTNGSQFFITLGPTAGLDSKHAVFGSIVDGMDVVNAIGAVATPVVAPNTVTAIQSITIERIGAPAQSFDALAPRGLPTLSDAGPELLHESSEFRLRFPRPPFTQHVLARSDSLNSWTRITTLTALSGPPATDYGVTSLMTGKPTQFFVVTQIGYSPQTVSLVNKTLMLQLTSSAQTLAFAVTGGPRSTTDFNLPLGKVRLDSGTQGNIGAYLYDPAINKSELRVATSNLGRLHFSLKFRTASQGWFTGRNLDAPGDTWPFFGTFEITDSP